MSTPRDPRDLNTKNPFDALDHPVNVIESEKAQAHPSLVSGMEKAQGILRGYEGEYETVFFSLDCDVLDAVREAFARSQTTDLDVAHLAMLDLRSAVNDLLGLDRP